MKLVSQDGKTLKPETLLTDVPDLLVFVHVTSGALRPSKNSMLIHSNLHFNSNTVRHDTIRDFMIRVNYATSLRNADRRGSDPFCKVTVWEGDSVLKENSGLKKTKVSLFPFYY